MQSGNNWWKIDWHRKMWYDITSFWNARNHFAQSQNPYQKSKQGHLRYFPLCVYYCHSLLHQDTRLRNSKGPIHLFVTLRVCCLSVWVLSWVQLWHMSMFKICTCAQKLRLSFEWDVHMSLNNGRYGILVSIIIIFMAPKNYWSNYSNGNIRCQSRSSNFPR